MTKEHDPALTPVRFRRVSKAIGNDTLRAPSKTGEGLRRKSDLGFA